MKAGSNTDDREIMKSKRFRLLDLRDFDARGIEFVSRSMDTKIINRIYACLA